MSKQPMTDKLFNKMVECDSADTIPAGFIYALILLWVITIKETFAVYRMKREEGHLNLILMYQRKKIK